LLQLLPFEEKILERQELKQTLADEVIGADEEGFGDLDREELLQLFCLDESPRKPRPACPVAIGSAHL